MSLKEKVPFNKGLEMLYSFPVWQSLVEWLFNLKFAGWMPNSRLLKLLKYVVFSSVPEFTYNCINAHI